MKISDILTLNSIVKSVKIPFTKFNSNSVSKIVKLIKIDRSYTIKQAVKLHRLIIPMHCDDLKEKVKWTMLLLHLSVTKTIKHLFFVKLTSKTIWVCIHPKILFLSTYRTLPSSILQDFLLSNNLITLNIIENDKSKPIFAILKRMLFLHQEQWITVYS